MPHAIQIRQTGGPEVLNRTPVRRLARELKQQDWGTLQASRSTNAAALSRLIGTAYSDIKCGLKTASRFAGGRGVKKRRVETCIRRYEQPESFNVT